MKAGGGSALALLCLVGMCCGQGSTWGHDNVIELWNLYSGSRSVSKFHLDIGSVAPFYFKLPTCFSLLSKPSLSFRDVVGFVHAWISRSRCPAHCRLTKNSWWIHYFLPTSCHTLQARQHLNSDFPKTCPWIHPLLCQYKKIGILFISIMPPGKAVFHHHRDFVD